MRVVFEAFGERHIDREILRIGDAAADAAPAFAVIDQEITSILSEQFYTEGARGLHGAWAELADSTITFKLNNDLRPEILRATDELMTSLIDPESSNAVREIGPQEYRRGTTVFYGEFHQRGHDAPTKLPQRRIFDFTETDKVKILKIMQLWIRKGEIPLV